MKLYEKMLTRLIGDELAEKCISEIRRKTDEDDSNYLKKTIQEEVTRKYIEKADLSIRQIADFVEQVPKYFTKDNLDGIPEAFNKLKECITSRLKIILFLDESEAKEVAERMAKEETEKAKGDAEKAAVAEVLEKHGIVEDVFEEYEKE